MARTCSGLAITTRLTYGAMSFATASVLPVASITIQTDCGNLHVDDPLMV